MVIYIMGVSGVGKTTIGKLLATKLGFTFYDGDDYHPKNNVDKMAQGIPLNDEDRLGWLTTLNQLAQEKCKDNCVIACSALREHYRELLQQGIELNTKWVFLQGDFDKILDQIKGREGHFMPSSLLQSQFDALEIPSNAFTVSIEKTPEQIVAEIVQEVTQRSQFGIIGLGVMGKSLARNFVSKNITLSVYNRTVLGKEENVATDFVREFELNHVQPFDDVSAFINSLQSPRKIMLMVNAGKPIDLVLEAIVPFLEPYDVVIDGGNSHYKETLRRIDMLTPKGIHFIGAGVSGGEEGALTGPAIMPGGERLAYQAVRPFLESVAAKNRHKVPCCQYVGPEGSGHFVKMVHNGIEYVEMQLLAEVYHLLFKGKGYSNEQIAALFEIWNQGELNSFLLEITIDILRKKENGTYLLDTVLDKAGNKGTGNWTTIAACELGTPATMVADALFSRYVSAQKTTREKAASVLGTKETKTFIDSSDNEIMQAYALARIINHHQGFSIIDEASKAYNWNLQLTTIASIWTNGCILRSQLIETLVDVLESEPTILFDNKLTTQVRSLKGSLADVVANGIKAEIPVSALSNAINYLNAFSKARLPANLIQAQRDCFGAHGYQKIDGGDALYHSNWKTL